jgi:GT2 family glycosyltransferase
MYFEYDTGVSADEDHVTSHRLVRVEHYGKGAPAFSKRYTRSRPVPAITGAFMSVSRPWYEKLGGFTEDFVFGSYEDADLCLKSLSAGVAAWIHDFRLWHMEGKGSTRLAVHEGGSHVNRALFSERWEAFIGTGLEGPNPSHPLLQGPLEPDTTLARASSKSSAQRGRA